MLIINLFLFATAQKILIYQCLHKVAVVPADICL